jgi:hypothetical protein
MKRLCALLVFWAFAAAAQATMTAEEFDAYVTGKTLYFSSNGTAYGAEQYLDDRRVRWTFLDGQCKDGVWYAQDGQICFVYEDSPDPQCWTFERTARGLRALFNGAQDATELYEARQSDEPMLCLGPDVGV